jgi:ribose/xylose/arabinose/galactoside ABC-type transport system permease subunit
VTLGSSFIVRGISLLMSENTTVIGLPAGIRDYGNDALLYYIRGEGGGLYFLNRPEVTGDLLRRMDPILPYPVVITALVVALAIFVLRKTRFGRHTYAIGGNLEAALRTGIPSTGTSSSSTCCPPVPPALPASFRPCASPPGRR